MGRGKKKEYDSHTYKGKVEMEVMSTTFLRRIKY